MPTMTEAGASCPLRAKCQFAIVKEMEALKATKALEISKASGRARHFD